MKHNHTNRSDDATTATLLATLRRVAPTKVRAYGATDEDVRDIAVPTRRRKWSQVIEAIEARAWTRIELMDKSGAVLGYIDNEGPANEVEDLTSRGAQTKHDAEWFVKITVQAMKDAMAMRNDETAALLAAQGAVVREMASGIAALSAVYREQVIAATDAARARAEAAAAGQAGEGSLKELLDAAPQIMQALPLLKSLLGNGTTPPNGAPKGH